MAAYLTRTAFKALTLAPASYSDFVETEEPGWQDAQLLHLSALLDAKLAKRYATPFDPASPPVVVEDWLQRLMTVRLYLKRGIDPTDRQVEEIRQDAKDAWAEVLDAANSKDGNTELPFRADAPGTDGVTRGTPLSYSETSPYDWSAVQACENEGPSGAIPFGTGRIW
jgi:hypothetical protein